MSDIEAQDCELEYWFQQAENYAEVQIPADDLRAIITRAWQARAQNATGRNDDKSAGAAARAAIAALRPTKGDHT